MNVIPFAVHQPSDWSQSELAEFYRVHDALGQAGIKVDADRGLTDEGDPWFAFYYPDSGDVIAQFSRIDGAYVISWADADGPQTVRGKDFHKLVRELVAALTPVRPRKLYTHPASLLAILIGTLALTRRDANAHEEHERSWHTAILIAAAVATAEIVPAAAAEHHDDAAMQITYTIDIEHHHDQLHQGPYQPLAPPQDASVEPQDLHHTYARPPLDHLAPSIEHLSAPDDPLPPIVGNHTYALDHSDLVHIAAFSAPSVIPQIQAHQPAPMTIPDESSAVDHVIFSALQGAQQTVEHVTHDLGTLPDTVLNHVVAQPLIQPTGVVPLVGAVVDHAALSVVSDVVNRVLAPVVSDVANHLVAPVVNEVVAPVMAQVTSVVDAVTHTAAPVVDTVIPLLDTVTHAAAPVVDQVVTPVVNEMVTPVVNPVVTSAMEAATVPIVGTVSDVNPMLGSLLGHH